MSDDGYDGGGGDDYDYGGPGYVLHRILCYSMFLIILDRLGDAAFVCNILSLTRR